MNNKLFKVKKIKKKIYRINEQTFLIIESNKFLTRLSIVTSSCSFLYVYS